MSATPLPVVLLEEPGDARLGPVAALRPAAEVRVGALNLRERLELCASAGEIRIGGEDPDAVALDGRLVAPVETLDELLGGLGPDDRIVLGDRVVARRGAGSVERAAPGGLTLVERPWQWIGLNTSLLVADAQTLEERGAPVRRIHGIRFAPGSARDALLSHREFARLEALPPGVHRTGDHPVLAAPGVELRPGVVLDATDGPIVLGAGVVVHPLSVIVGPSFLGPGAIVNPGSRIREGTSAGAFCKLGGEIEECLIMDLSNKQHDGFLGHAVVGSWVNLGADTNGSDLKNNYSSVRVDLGQGPEDTGLSFVGPLIGDHAKTGINTMLTTGAVLGVAANVFGGDFAPRNVPAFSWGGAGGLVEYRIEDAVATARKVMERREVVWTAGIEESLRDHFEATAAARRDRGIR